MHSPCPQEHSAVRLMVTHDINQDITQHYKGNLKSKTENTKSIEEHINTVCTHTQYTYLHIHTCTHTHVQYIHTVYRIWT